ncbi:MAG: RnfABCDGE type electron transport complex subunit D [Lachnospiraceae bacterium]|nr:RnfABCDGE type electron transport complex subunit D [Lachnospiraceae bacterium]
MSDSLHVSANPHVRSKESTGRIMFLVIIALLPATGFGIYNFGYQAAVLIAVTIATTVLTEFVYEKLMKLPVTVSDLSAVVTGLLIALNLPPEATWWMGIIGSVFAILVVITTCWIKFSKGADSVAN